MTLSKAIDRYLAWRKLERDATPRSLGSYYRILRKKADWLEARLGPDVRLTDLEGRQGTELLRECIAVHVGHRSASTRSNWISVFHSFWQWAESEDLVESDPSRKIRRPPKRKPDIYRPSDAELRLAREATTIEERGAWLLMEGIGLRASSVVGVRWEHVDLTRGRIRVFTKGAHWRRLPIAPDVLEELRAVYRALEPKPTDYVFTVEEERWIDNEHRIRRRRNPAEPSTPKALWSMVRRICARAGIRPLGPHALRHGFATRLKRQGIDLYALQLLMGHADPKTTEAYTDELLLEELDEALLQASSWQATSTGEPAIPLVEAAGIEPASAPASDDTASDSESEPPLDAGDGVTR